MYVLFIVLNEREYLSEVLFKMNQLGIRGATVIDSMGAKAVNQKRTSIPILSSMMQSLEGDTQFNNTIFSVIEREEQVERVMEHIEKILGGDMKRPNKGIMFVLPVTHMRGGELHRHIESRENKKVIAQEIESEYY
ncbi:P-II family nitrogen regulator [Vallitalea okinawensis]|uniref:P-II family nitrogen regulator n=1 Tax=Vallitalea okinawensis TaxID=2078660 RepID=UPI000CFAE5F9|nr:hypothetical protein [Vallitalea okinawensis]